MVTVIWVNIGSGNSMLPHNTKPLTEPILQLVISEVHWQSTEGNSSTVNQYNKLENYFSKISFQPPSGQWVKFPSYCINGLVQDCSNSIANAMELLQSCTKPSIFHASHVPWFVSVAWQRRCRYKNCSTRTCPPLVSASQIPHASPPPTVDKRVSQEW